MGRAIPYCFRIAVILQPLLHPYNVLRYTSHDIAPKLVGKTLSSDRILGRYAYLFVELCTYDERELWLTSTANNNKRQTMC